MLIPQEQVKVHKVTEAAAVFIGVPFLVYVASQTDNPFIKTGSMVFAGLTLLVDGGLLLAWRKK